MKAQNSAGFLVVLFCSFGFGLSTFAQEVSWSGGTSTSYDVPTNWVGGSLPPPDDGSLRMDATTIGTGSFTLDVPDPISLHSLNFSDGPFVLTGQQITLSPAVSGTGIDEVYHSTLINANNSIVTIYNDLYLVPLTIERPLLPTNDVLDIAEFSANGGSLTMSGNVDAGSMKELKFGSGVFNVDGSLSAKTLSSQGTLNLNGSTNVANLNAYGLFVLNGEADITNRLQLSQGGSISGLLKTAQFHSSNGDVSISGNGSIETTGALHINSGRLIIDNSSIAKNNRVGTSIDVHAGEGVSLIGNNSVAVSEQAGALYSGNSTVEVQADGHETALRFSALNTSGPIDFKTEGAFGSLERVYFDTAPAMTSGLLDGATVNSREFAAYDGTLGVTSATTSTDLTTAVPLNNVYATGNHSLSSNTSVNSLALDGNITTTGGQLSLLVSSGKVLVSGNSSIDPTLDFDNARGDVSLNGSTSTSVDGFDGNAGVTVHGSGSLALTGSSAVHGTADFSGLNLLTLTADNALSNADVNVDSANFSIGSTTQNMKSLRVSGQVTGNGSIDTGTRDIVVHNNGAALNASLAGRSIIVTGSPTITGSLTASDDVSVSSAEVSGVIGGTGELIVGGGSKLTANNTYTGNTTVRFGNLLLEGSGSINDSSNLSVEHFSALELSYSGESIDRVGDNANISLADTASFRVGNISGSSIVEHGGDLVVAGGDSGAFVSVAGSATLSVDAIDVSAGNTLLLDLDTSNGAQVKVNNTLATYANSSVLKDIEVRKEVNGGTLNFFSTYDATDGVTEAPLTEVSTLSGINNHQLFARVTDATSSSITQDATVAAVVFDTTNTVNGSGSTLNTAIGKVMFLQDNTVNIGSINFGSAEGEISNAGENTISGNLVGSTGFVKTGNGTLNLDGNSNIAGGVRINEGTLSTTGSISSNVTVGFGGGELKLAGNSAVVNGNVDGSLSVSNRGSGQAVTGSVTGQISLNDSHIQIVDGQTFNNTSVDENSSVNNMSTTTGAVTSAGSLVNTGEIGTVSNSSSSVTVNEGVISSASNSGTLTNKASGTVGNINNFGGGTVENNGSMGVASGSINDGDIKQKAGNFTISEGAELSGVGTFEMSGGTTTINGRLINEFEMTDGTLMGSGVIQGDVLVTGGIINPGNSPGDLTIEGAFSLMGGVLELEWNGEASHDRLIVGGQFLTGSNAIIEIVLGADATSEDLASGNVFDSLFGGMSSEQLGSALSGVGLRGSSDEGQFGLNLVVDESGQITGISDVPLPASLWLFGSALVGLFSLRKRQVVPSQQAV